METSNAKCYHTGAPVTSTLLVIAVFLAAGHAAAQAATEPEAPGPEAPDQETLEQAAQLFERAEQAYNEGEAAHAVELLERAHELVPEPVLLYNLARAHEALGHFEQAVDHYERYLREVPEPRDRGAIRRRVATLRRQMAAAEDGTDPEPRPPPPPPRASPLPPLIFATGGAVVVGGAVTGLLANGQASDAAEASSHRAGADALDRARTLATLANVLFVAGGVLAAAGLTWWILDSPGGEAREGLHEASVGVGPGQLALRLRWR